MLRGEAKRKAEAFGAELRRLLQTSDDRALLGLLEARSGELPFRGFSWLWAPHVYARNRVLFRPLISANLATFLVVDKSWERVEWKGEVAKALAPWLEAVDRDDDVALFKVLYQWRAGDTLRRKVAAERWRRELRERFERAGTPATRAVVLRKFDMWFELDEDSALALYRLDRTATADFVLKHLPQRWYGGEKRVLWEKLFEAARAQGDEALQFRLYRRMVPKDRWRSDVKQLVKSIADAEALCAELEKRHPEGWGLDLGTGLHELVVARGRDVLPYVRRHLRDVYSGWLRGGYDKLVEHARREGWWDFWGLAVSTCARPNEYNAAVKSLLADDGLDDAKRRERLLLLTGVSREWNFAGLGLAQVHRLEEDVALALYRRFPDLVRGPFRLHVQPSWGNAAGRLLDAAIEADDDVLVDFLASRLVTRAPGHGASGEQRKAAEAASRYYEALRLDEAAFARRAAAVLTQVPAYAIWRYGALVQENRLARLLFERSSRVYLASEAAVRDLVEASEIHVQQLGYRALGLDDPRAAALAAANVDLLLGTLLRPLHRATRAAALGALANAAATPEVAARVLARAREAFELPDTHYPKDALVQLVGRILHRFPELRAPGETPTIYRRAA